MRQRVWWTRFPLLLVLTTCLAPEVSTSQNSSQVSSPPPSLVSSEFSLPQLPALWPLCITGFDLCSQVNLQQSFSTLPHIHLLIPHENLEVSQEKAGPGPFTSIFFSGLWRLYGKVNVLMPLGCIFYQIVSRFSLKGRAMEYKSKEGPRHCRNISYLLQQGLKRLDGEKAPWDKCLSHQHEDMISEPTEKARWILNHSIGGSMNMSN